jgi:hypothetical protein
MKYIFYWLLFCKIGWIKKVLDIKNLSSRFDWNMRDPTDIVNLFLFYNFVLDIFWLPLLTTGNLNSSVCAKTHRKMQISTEKYPKIPTEI